MSAAYGLEPRAGFGDAPDGRVLLYLPGAHRAAENTLSEIENRIQDARRTSRPTGKSL